MNITMAQLDFRVGDIQGNADIILKASNTAISQEGSKLIIFPELALTGYSPEDVLLREELHLQCHAALKYIIDNMPDITIALGMPWKTEDALYNSAIVLQNKKVIAKYHKRCLANYTVFDEKRYFQAGSSTTTFTLENKTFGILVCKDTWHDDIMLETKESGAEYIISLNASPFDASKAGKRHQMLKQQTQERCLPTFYVNLVGAQDELVFDGGSIVTDTNGNIHRQGAYFKEELVTINTDNLSQNNTIINEAIPNKIELIYNALVLGVREYIQKNSFNGALLGLSGGIDSALTLAIAVDAIGHNNITTVMMPSKYTSELSLNDATQLAKNLNVKHITIPINNITDITTTELSSHLKPKIHNTTAENIQARTRGVLLMALSNNTGAIVLTTGNKSELAVGYSTLYGDMAGGFAVLKDIPKTMVYKLAEYYNERQSKDIIPQSIIQRAPSAELSPNQTDQDSLPPYEILDEILYYYIDQKYSSSQIKELGFSQNTINRVIKLVNHNEYKRRQSPIGIRISESSFGKDRRHPITITNPE